MPNTNDAGDFVPNTVPGPAMFRQLFAYNAWANRRLWTVLDALDEPALDVLAEDSGTDASPETARLEASPDDVWSIRRHCVHVVSVEHWWPHFLATGQLDFFAFERLPSKPEIRAIARQLGLKVAEKQDSQEICFVPGNDYKAFLKSHLGAGEFHPGGIYDKTGQRLAEHEGIEMFTIGQRKDLPGGSAKPRYVIDIDPATNRVLVDDADIWTLQDDDLAEFRNRQI